MVKREEKEEEEKKKERDYSCIVTANACVTDTLCILSNANWTLRSEIAADENRGNRLFTLFGIASAWHARARASELTENKFRPVSNSADPPWNYVTHIPSADAEIRDANAKASRYEIKPPLVPSRSKTGINRASFLSFSFYRKIDRVPSNSCVENADNSRERA